MRKEVILAVIIGLSLGLLLTFGIYRAGTSLTRPEPVTSNPSAQPSATPASPLAWLSPEDESIQSELSTTVAGNTIANSYVTIFVNDTPYLTTADAAGNFSVQVRLENGSNVIQVHTLDENGNEIIDERTVIVASSEPLTAASSSATPSPSATTRATTSPRATATPRVSPSPSANP